VRHVASEDQQVAQEEEGESEKDEENKTLAEIQNELGIAWKKLLALLRLPPNVTGEMTLGEARRIQSGSNSSVTKASV